MDLILEKLKSIVGSDFWRSTSSENLKYFNDINNYQNGLPSIILLPTSSIQISQILKICNSYKLPVSIQGGMTGLVQGAVPFNNEIVISLEKMNSIVEFDKTSLNAIVQSGVSLENFQKLI